MVQKIIAKLKSEKVIMGLIALVLLLAFGWINSQNTAIGFLNVMGLDEFEQAKYLWRMYDGLIHLNPIRFLSCHGFVYGFGSFWVSFVITLPFLIANNSDMVIFMARMISATSIVIWLLETYIIAKHWVSRPMAAMLTSLWLTVPLVWKLGTWNHPDALMLAFIAVSIGYLLKDALATRSLTRSYWISLILLAIAIATKLQIIIIAPFLVIYVVLQSKSWSQFAKTALISLVIASGLYLAICPYLLHPVGRYAVMRSTLGTMAYNANNHGKNTLVPTIDKWKSVTQNIAILPIVALLILGGSAQFIGLKNAKKTPLNSVQISLAITGLASLMYLLYGVNKAWPHYYVPTLWMVFLAAVPLVKKLQTYLSEDRLVLIVVLLITTNMVLMVPQIKGLAIDPPKDMDTQRQRSAAIVTLLSGQVSANTHMLISSKTGFAYDKLGLTNDQVQFIYGPLTLDMIDEAAFIKKWKKVDLKKYPVRRFFVKNWIVFRTNDPLLTPQKSELIKQLFDGKLGYRVWFQNHDLIILKYTK